MKYLKKKNQIIELIAGILKENFGEMNISKAKIEKYIDKEYIKNYLMP